ncbi:MAG: LuxR C-terminal-related transcriptional regulator [Nitrospiraceae bacterium]
MRRAASKPARKPSTMQKPLKALPQAKFTSPHPVTPRQKEILRFVAQGLTNREIAGHLKISVRTVEVHRFNLMRRLRVRNVAQLLRQALVMRLLPKSYHK